MGLLAWGVAAVAYVGAKGARAENQPTFHDVDGLYLVPQNGEWFYVRVDFLMFDSGDGNFEAAAATARAEMLANFPGAVEVEESSVSAAYVLSNFKWMSGSVAWTYDASGAPNGLSAQPAIAAGATTWASQGAAFQFTGGGSSSNGTEACGGSTDGSNTVGWGAQSGSVLAVTCSWYQSQGNPRPAVEFDMEFDPDWNWTTGSPIQVDLQSVSLHEFGHAAGIGHSSISGAVMFASYTQGTNKRTPHQDDKDALIEIYGASGFGNPTNTPTNTPPAGTNTPTNTPTRTPTPTNTPNGPTNTPTNTPTGPTNTPTQPLPTSAPTQTPTPGGSNPTAVPTQPLPTSTPTTKPSTTVSPTATFSPTATAQPSATPTPGSGTPSLPILPGANLLAWPGNDMSPAQALAGVPNLRIVYAWDAVTGNWSRYIPGAPGYLNNLTSLKKGVAYWFIASGSALIPVQP